MGEEIVDIKSQNWESIWHLGKMWLKYTLAILGIFKSNEGYFQNTVLLKFLFIWNNHKFVLSQLNFITISPPPF